MVDAYYVDGTDKTTVKLNLSLSSITKYDSNIAQWGLEGNSEIADLLYKNAAVLPLTGDQFTSAKYAVFQYIEWQFYIYTKDNESADRLEKQYDKARNALIEKLQAQVVNSGDNIAVATDYRSWELSVRESYGGYL